MHDFKSQQKTFVRSSSCGGYFLMPFSSLQGRFQGANDSYSGYSKLFRQGKPQLNILIQGKIENLPVSLHRYTQTHYSLLWWKILFLTFVSKNLHDQITPFSPTKHLTLQNPIEPETLFTWMSHNDNALRNWILKQIQL